MIRARGLDVTLGVARLLRGVSVDFAAGDLSVILGPNGAGKSTLLQTLSGTQKPTAGSIEFFGRPLESVSEAERARRRALMSQDTPSAFDLMVSEVVALGRLPHRKTSSARRDLEIVAAAMEDAGVSHLAQRNITQLSGGERQRVHLARALAQIAGSDADHDAAALFLDEPTASLDPQHQHQVLGHARRLAHRGLVVVAVLHDLALAARYATHVVLLHQGEVHAAGSPRTTLTEAHLRQVFRVSAQVGVDDEGLPWVVTTGLSPRAAPTRPEKKKT